ncbi:hypothetical protein [Schlesneria sp. T3-172]|uniref:Kelch repeat-containing protein n=1 Tax=Schlesneria sphaerica TaxID=3373610 RepID=UPI0037C59AFC
MRIRRLVLGLLLMVVSAPATSWGHFVWIASGSQAKDGKVHVYFAEAVEPDDPDLLNKLATLKLWQVSQDGKATELKTTKDADSLVADATESSNSIFTVSHNYGILARGDETFLLKYHAKSLPSSDPKSWRGVGNAAVLPFEIVPSPGSEKTVLTVLWQGKPLEGSIVTVTGPGIEKKLESTTDAKGVVEFDLKSAGLYSIRAKHSEAIKGEHEGKAYTSVRHYTTLALTRADAGDKVSSTASPSVALPPLDPGVTSFGAAIIDNTLYVYGGHFGKPHHYSKDGQSANLMKLDLSHPSKWEVASTGPKRTGLAAVAHGGKFYRIGGFEARNAEADKQSLWSMSDFARFDPKTNQWETLPSLPEGRSSHDALVIGNILYVVGGWELQGEGESKWHDTAYTVDLSADQLEWKSLPQPPFQRRALALGEWQGKVVAVGGMQSKGGTTTATAIYDPKTQAWAAGPKLNGEDMDGFGSSAFLCADKLCVTTFSGSIQILSDDGSKWVNAGKVAHPRFFHRMLPLNATQALIVGGANMKTGKIIELETIPVSLSASGD